MTDSAPLRNFIAQLYPLKDEELDVFCDNWQPIECKRKTILTAAGETERYLYFVVEGVQRAFYIGEEKQEATVVFMYPPSFGGIADSFLTQTPSAFFYETLTRSCLLRTSYKQTAELTERYPAIQRMILQLAGYVIKGLLTRQVELQCYSAEEKFRALLKRSPHVLQLIPHKYLASYLGLDATTFSKLLGSVRI
jgi:CRP-like cAMP-binding protein